MRTNGLAIVLAGIAIVLVSGCGGGGPSNVALKDPQMLFINAVPDSDGLDFYMNETKRAANVKFPQSSKNFIFVPFIGSEEDAYDVYVEDSVTKYQYDSEARVFDLGTSTIVVAFGLKNHVQGDEAKRVFLTFLTPETRTPPLGNRCRLLVFHGYNRAPGLENPAIDFQNVGDNPLYKIENMLYGRVQALEIDSGEYIKDVANPANSNYFVAKRNDAEGVLVEALDSFKDSQGNTKQGVNLLPGRIYFVLVTGVEGQTGVQRPRMVFIDIPTE
jgi:hypothetical protein